MNRPRFFQVSIRTLLIPTTLVAIGLGYWTRIQHRMQEQKLAVARITSLGGSVVYDFEAGKAASQPPSGWPWVKKPTPPGWPWLRKLLGDEYFQDVVGITLDETQVSDADLALISKLRGMKSLSARGPEVSADGKYLIKKGSQFNFTDPSPFLSKFTDEGILRLGPQQNLQDANLAHTSIGDAGVQVLAQSPHLEVLNLAGTQVTARGIQRLEKLEHLKSLDLGQTKVDDDALASFCRMRTLEILNLHETAVSGAGLFKLREELPACKLSGSLLDLSAGIEPDPENMRWKEITRPMWDLSRRGELKLLVLAGTAVTDLHLKDLDRLENTDMIDLRRTKVTDAGVAALQRALPKCKIVR